MQPSTPLRTETAAHSQRKPGALRNGAPIAELAEGFKHLHSQLLKRPGGDREMVEILALLLHHDEQVVPTGVEMALESGAPSKQHILNLLGRLVGVAATSIHRCATGLGADH